MFTQPRAPLPVFTLCLTALLGLAAASVLTGAGRVAPEQVLDYLMGARGDHHLEMVVTTLRLPRTLAALVVGAALGVSGMLLQAVTRNPLAETGLLGVNSGAALGVVVGIVYAGAQTGGAYLVWALGGALLATGVVLLIGSRFSPLKLVLAGAALSATLTGITSALLVADPVTFDQYRFWVLGSLAGVPLERVLSVSPAILAGLGLAALAARPLAALSLGDDMAVALGHRPGRTRVAVTVAVTLLSAAAVAVAGPIGFLGLLAGYLARTLLGGRVGPQIVLSGLAGALVLLGADVLARVVMRPYEAPVSLLIAVLGGPVLIVVARSRAVAAGAGDLISGGAARRGAGLLRPPLEGVRRILRRRAGADRAGGTRPDGARAAGLSAPAVRRRAAGSGPGRGPLPSDTLPVRLGALSVLLPVRSSFAAVALAALAVAAGVAALVAGQSAMSAGQALDALRGTGTGGQILLVQEIRLPRIVAGLVAGAALGLSGCLTQALARNRLATPDMLGINQGAVIAIMLAGLVSSAEMLFEHWWTGPLGALAATAVVFAISGGVGTQGYRFIVTGLAVTTLGGALTQSALAWNGLSSATAIHSWSVGSLAGRGYPVALPVAAGLALLLPAALAVSRRLDVMRFSEDVGAGLGADPRRTRSAVLALAVALAGLAIGIGGPIAFVALAAPVIAARLSGPARLPLVGAPLTGAALVVAADTIGRVVASGAEIPAGVVTSILGGPFLLWTLLSDRRS
ncbi:iron chelate uptake ABC transporter family permease subunit [Planomonospora sp. ID82291]|uniref:iron chelate uptake ABC transporter family permease subunit n=1 Tax=Planomonospora sp. ID82291 TaxID=2738136 RepID=UPI0018C4012D|nr:iron chelate uptake ABC transporter family permease subunit [Planomonospora sp. ID82291]MBG0815473.1 iron chelate uptake ABC transporter family permease subunit [Planomonospora sp. ID82291]